ncbi:S49 family peptidase [Plastoroseomonas arctica]|uniref:S49 family peptidase n=1 Tax=Plastoroseomonas arctica TaxID=1509237 RepID=A0AAF1JW38_9PROT|nr:S49 family peptidase [Plastoroseomonas arctica]MBR0654889.1 S49 family peptidase [Plastoroseomonas arctica]
MHIPFFDKRPRVALLRLSGLIASRGSPLTGGSINDTVTGPMIERAFAIKRLAGVVIAINSPGGSPVQSALVAGRIRRLAEEKGVPVIAVVEDAAASGGYWIACAADEIVANASSILGSIGVISAGFGADRAIEKLGIERRLRTAGTEKSFLDPFRSEDQADVARLEELLASLHEEFKDWVRTRRGAKLTGDPEALFTGRFWIGRRAVALGLADALGTTDGVILSRWGKDAKVITIGAPRRPIPWRWLPGPESLVMAIEERAAWGRLGL